MRTFETEMLTEGENSGSLAHINRELIGKRHGIDPARRNEEESGCDAGRRGVELIVPKAK